MHEDDIYPGKHFDLQEAIRIIRLSDKFMNNHKNLSHLKDETIGGGKRSLRRIAALMDACDQVGLEPRWDMIEELYLYMVMEDVCKEDSQKKGWPT